MKIHRNWRWILRRAWSVRLIIVAAVLSAAEAGLSLLGGLPGVSPGAFAVLSAVMAGAALGARLIAQRGGDDE